MRSFQVDLGRIRVRPLEPWQRDEATWDDIMDEIEEKHGVEALTRRLTQAEREIEAMRRLMKQSVQLHYATIELHAETMTNLNSLLAKLQDRDD